MLAKRRKDRPQTPEVLVSTLETVLGVGKGQVAEVVRLTVPLFQFGGGGHGTGTVLMAALLVIAAVRNTTRRIALLVREQIAILPIHLIPLPQTIHLLWVVAKPLTLSRI